jgi:hypothetical protein
MLDVYRKSLRFTNEDGFQVSEFNFLRALSTFEASGGLDEAFLADEKLTKMKRSSRRFY